MQALKENFNSSPNSESSECHHIEVLQDTIEDVLEHCNKIKDIKKVSRNYSQSMHEFLEYIIDSLFCAHWSTSEQTRSSEHIPGGRWAFFEAPNCINTKSNQSVKLGEGFRD